MLYRRKEMAFDMNRRKLVQTATATGLLVGTAMVPASERQKTPRDFTGPFYPRGPRNRTNDLIAGTPRTDVLHLTGKVVEPSGAPYTGALVDIWQADPQGRYKHPRDGGQDRLLEEFLYSGEAVTDARGGFAFRTYVPGRYAARPAQHIHYKVWVEGREVLTSQIYFDELGGNRGFARSSEAAALQTVQLVQVDGDNVRASIDIVI